MYMYIGRFDHISKALSTRIKPPTHILVRHTSTHVHTYIHIQINTHTCTHSHTGEDIR